MSIERKKKEDKKRSCGILIFARKAIKITFELYLTAKNEPAF